MKIATGKEERPPELDTFAAAFSVAGEDQEKVADEETLVLLKRFSRNPGIDKARLELPTQAVPPESVAMPNGLLPDQYFRSNYQDDLVAATPRCATGSIWASNIALLSKTAISYGRWLTAKVGIESVSITSGQSW
jgi:hypothetical protein